MKNFLNTVFLILLLAGISTALYYVRDKQKSQVLKEIQVNISYSGEDIFISPKEIKAMVLKADRLIESKKIAEINSLKLEQSLLQNPYVSTADVFAGFEGTLVVDVKQRQPLMRINTEKASFYLDTEGYVLPVHPEYVSRVVLVNGYVKKPAFAEKTEKNKIDQQNAADLYRIYELVKYTGHDPFLQALIEQIYVHKNQEIELVPKIGKNLILFGKAENLEEKFAKLLLFYKQGIPQSNAKNYKTINLKYEGQIVCEK